MILSLKARSLITLMGSKTSALIKVLVRRGIMHSNNSRVSQSLSSILESAYTTAGFDFISWGDIAPYVPQIGDFFPCHYPIMYRTETGSEAPQVVKKEYINVPAPSYPICDLYIEQDGAMRIEIAITGFDESDIDIAAVGTSLTISGSVPCQDQDKPQLQDKKIYGKIKVESFLSTYECDDTYDVAAAKANIKKGILTVRVPLKKEFVKERVAIKIGS